MDRLYLHRRQEIVKKKTKYNEVEVKQQIKDFFKKGGKVSKIKQGETRETIAVRRNITINKDLIVLKKRSK